MIVTHKYKKRPKPENAEKRSLSFMPEETKTVKDTDVVNISVLVGSLIGKTVHEIEITMSGADFLRKLEDRKTKSSGEDFFVFRF